MGMRIVDKTCLLPKDYPLLAEHQRVNQLHGFRRTLWRKDTFCRIIKQFNLVAAQLTPEKVSDLVFTFKCDQVMPIVYTHATPEQYIESYVCLFPFAPSLPKEHQQYASPVHCAPLDIGLACQDQLEGGPGPTRSHKVTGSDGILRGMTESCPERVSNWTITQ
jgi:hypothetical protein